VFAASVLRVTAKDRLPSSEGGGNRESNAAEEKGLAMAALEGALVLLFMKPDQQRGLRRAGGEVRVRVYDPILLAIPITCSLRKALSDGMASPPTHAIIGTQCWETLEGEYS
jgi:hypothetical protein